MKNFIWILIIGLPSLAFAQVPQPFSQSLPNDQAANLVDELKFQRLDEMDLEGLKSATLSEHPWSSTYWPSYLGILANRYGDPAFPGSGDWKQNAVYVEQHLGASAPDLLSPAEKYDLLVGDTSFTLTHRMLAEGQRYYQQYGTVETWMGICHGWSPASFMVPRPEHVIRVLAADGQTWIQFYPTDIKGLASLLWSDGASNIHSIGGRCNDKTPSLDPLKRPASPDCLDTNPGAWHLSVVNQIGVSHRSFVMDAEWSSQVWNQPVFSYSYTYFNPKTQQSVQKLQDAQVELAAFPGDRFRAVRAPSAVAVVGVEMDLTYTVETWPTQAKTDDPSSDALRSVHYQYDLELDEQGRIIGGEWHEQEHPDFLWVPARGSTAESVGDTILNRVGDHQSWNGASSLPVSWRSAAKRASANGQPLQRIVDELVGMSRIPNGIN